MIKWLLGPIAGAVAGGLIGLLLGVFLGSALGIEGKWFSWTLAALGAINGLLQDIVPGPTKRRRRR